MQWLKYKSLLGLSLTCVFLGLLFAGLKRGWIIIQFPICGPVIVEQAAREQQCTLWFLTVHGWRSEKQKCVLHQDQAVAIEHVVNAWLGVAKEDKAFSKTVQATACLSPEQVIYLSFDRSPFTGEQSLQEQWFFIEGLLRTLREQMPEVRYCQFLVDNKPLSNRHLDFDHPWPINGFLSR